jgi:thiol:disulfide interchange protein DsbC
MKVAVLKTITTILFIFLLTVPAAWCQSCPSKEQLAQILASTFGGPVNILDVRQGAVHGLCEIIVPNRGKNAIIYSDKRGRFLINGQIIDTATGTNLTRQAIAILNRLTPEEMETVKMLPSFSLGTGEKEIYLATDPHCHYCKDAEEVLVNLAGEGLIKVNFILYPVLLKKGSKEICISILCDNKGFDGLIEEYSSENQCEEGTRKIEETIAFMDRKKLGGTPIFIHPDGRYFSGSMTEFDVRRLLALPPKQVSGPAGSGETTPEKEAAGTKKTVETSGTKSPGTP